MFSRSFVVGLVIGILGGVVLGMLAVLVSGAQREPTTQQIFVPVTQTPAPEVSPTPDTRPRARVAVTVRSGPSSNFVVLGVLNRGALLQPIGRNTDADWLAIRYPPGSTSSGWVQVEDVEGIDDAASLAIVQATPLPLAASPPLNFSPQALTPGPTDPTGPAAASVTPVPLPDLIVAEVTLLSDGRVSARIGNVGGPLQDGFIFVRFGDALGEIEVVQATPTVLPQGGVVVVTSQGLRARSGDAVRVTVNPAGDVRESNYTNNSREVTFGAAAS